MDDLTHKALCLGCDYPLRGLREARCPECGKGFDPGDARTMNTGRPLGWVWRGLYRPMSWWPVVLMALVVAGLAGATSWRIEWGVPSLVEVRYYARTCRSVQAMRELRMREWVYVVSVVGGGAVAGWWMMATVLRAATSLLRRQAFRVWGRRWAAVVMVVVGVAAAELVLCAWPYRLGRVWVEAEREREEAEHRAAMQGGPGSAQACARAADREASIVAGLGDKGMACWRAVVLRAPDVRERHRALRYVAEQHPSSQRPALLLSMLLAAVEREEDAGLLATELRLIALFRKVETVPTLRKFLEHGSPVIRATAIDAVGIVYAPAYDVPLSASEAAPVIGGERPVGIWSLLYCLGHPKYLDRLWPIPCLPTGRTPPPAEWVAWVRQRMLDGSTAEERDAAARAALLFPPAGYRLRYAEWGVWIGQRDGRLARMVRAEIPAFAHATGGRIDRTYSGVEQVTKPIIHLTSSHPMSVDIDVQIRGGRPWYAYPMPDDFAVTIDPASKGRQDGTEDLDGPQAGEPPAPGEAEMREGYPWVEPHHRFRRNDRAGWGWMHSLGAAGLHWQSLIVSPERLGWMRPPEVGEREEYRWWKRLREVDCSWVSNRGEAERFVYYDGPSSIAGPVAVTLSGDAVEFRGQIASGHRGLLIEVTGGRSSGCVVAVPAGGGTVALNALARVHGDGVRKEWRDLLTQAGLTGSEAEGLIDSWRKAALEMDGRRFLMLLSREEYDRLCPLVIRPAPTESARVGIVWVE